MRIKAIRARDIAPIKTFEVESLSDVVVIAGPNGVGKTRLIEALLAYFQNLSGDAISFVVEATHKNETAAWSKTELDTSIAGDAQLLTETLQKNRRRRNFLSSVLYYESDRSIQNIKPLQFEWEMTDPWEEELSWNMTFGGLRKRFQDTLHAIFKKLQSQKTSIANRAIALRRDGHSSMNLDFTDPMDPFRDVFYQLLAPKVLENPDVRNQTLRYQLDGQTFDINSLSSGEREVLNITFDFILRQPSHCLVFFDEPELHLHPELSGKLISTLKIIGNHNQFILCSHSPDIISTSLEDSVVFLTPPKDDGGNQGIVIRADDDTSEALHRLGHSVGVVSLGKKIVLIEGTYASLDKQVYTHILRNRFPNLVLLPSGGKGNLRSFNTILREILDRAIWGVDFFMLADRDAMPIESDATDLEAKSGGRFRTLARYHLENYFLEPMVLAEVFKEMEPAESWLRDPDQIDSVLCEIAESQIGYATSLIVSKHVRAVGGNIDIMPKDCHGKADAEVKSLIVTAVQSEKSRLTTVLDDSNLSAMVTETQERLRSSIDADGDAWRAEIPGKPVFRIFCGKAKLTEGRLKSLYINKAEKLSANPLQDAIDIFQSFSTMEREGV